MTTTDLDVTLSSSQTNGHVTNENFAQPINRNTSGTRARIPRHHAIALAIASLPVLAGAQPLGGQVVSGNASIVQTGAPGQTLTTVKQNSATTSINWQSFNLGVGDTVKFIQPSKDAIAVNRISDTAGSKILGTIQANGQVWLLNPNGILFGKDAQINVGGLLASTLNTLDPVASGSTSNAVQGLRGSSKAPVVNLGQIKTTEGGYVALLGHSVSNQGSIKADQGSIALGAGSDLSLQFEGSRLLSVKVNQHQLDALAGNGGLLQADGGRVILTAGARDSVLASAVNNTGVVQARTVQKREGSIVLLAGMKAGQLNVAGTLDASAPERGRGGFIETSAAHVQIDNGLQLSTRANEGLAGEWLIDPTDFTVGRGNVTQSSSGMSGTKLSELLDKNNITIETDSSSGDQNGDIFINAAVSWNSPYKLTLKAYRDIYINDAITSSHSNGQLHLAFGQASADGVVNGRQSKYWVNAPVNLAKGNNFFTQSGSAAAVKSYYVITELGKQGSTTGTDLQGIDKGTPSQTDVQNRNYVLGADIDASETKNWNGKQGFKSLFITDFLTDEISFQGTFDGLGHVISGLTINKPGIGVQSLFSVVGKNGVVQNLGMKNVNYLTNNTGGITFRNFGTIRNSFVEGGAIISGDRFTNASNFMGGLVGNNLGLIENSYANVTVGMPDNNNSYASSKTANYKIGGLVGLNSGSIINSYANGLSYASQRTVTGSDGKQTPLFYVGGLVGQSIYSSSATAKHSVTGSVWNAQANTSPASLPAGMKSAQTGIALVDKSDAAAVSATGLDSQQMMKASNFSAWNKDSTWIMYDTNARPLLRAFMTPLYLKSKADGSKTYDGSVNFSTGKVQVPGKDTLTKTFEGTLTLVLNDPNAGYRQAVASGYYSDQVGYQIVYDFDVNKVLVEKAPLTFTADKASFTIGQTIDGLSGTYKGLVGSETLSTATKGSLKWKSSVSDTLKPGSFAIEADGLSAGNYELKQDPANQTALTVRPVETPAVIPASTAFNQKPLSYLQPSSGNSNSKTGVPDAVASAPVTSKESGTSGGIYEFCLPKPPSMLSVASATCVRGKQP